MAILGKESCHMTPEQVLSLVSEVSSGLIGLVAIGGTVMLAYHGYAINSTLMVIDGAVVGAFFALKGVTGTTAAVKAVMSETK